MRNKEFGDFTRVLLLVAKWAAVLFLGYVGASFFVKSWAQGELAPETKPVAAFAMWAIPWAFISVTVWYLLRFFYSHHQKS